MTKSSKKYWILSLLLLTSLNAGAYEIVNEKDFDLQDYAGKFVYLDFWASWCVPCAKSFPWMRQLDKQYSNDDLVIVAVGIDKKQDKFDKFLQKYPAKFTIVRDADSKLAKQFQLQGMPSSYLIDPKGEVVYTHVGFRKKDIPSVEAKIATIIKSK